MLTFQALALRLANHDLTGQAMAAAASRATGNAADFVREARIPAVYYGCNYATAHSDEERVTLAEVSERISYIGLPASWDEYLKAVDGP